MPTLPIFNTSIQELSLLQTRWASELNPVLRNPSLQSIILTNVALTSGANVINHLLGRKLQGWRIVRLRGPANVYDTQDSNPSPKLTLQLVSDADVVADLEVF